MKIISLMKFFFQFGCIWIKWMKFNCNHNEMIHSSFINWNFIIHFRSFKFINLSLNLIWFQYHSLIEIIGFRFHSYSFYYFNQISFSFIIWRLLDFIIHLQWRFHGINYHWLFQSNSKSFIQIAWSLWSCCHLTELW